mgnify:CR=1 FL=1
MEELINSIPKEKTWTQRNGEILHHGFFLRYSPSRNKWLCGYGRIPSNKLLNVSFVEANDPVEAVVFLIELRKHKK